MTLPYFFSCVLLAVPIYIVANKLIKKTAKWEDVVKMVCVYGPAIFVYWMLQGEFASAVDNIITVAVGSASNSADMYSLSLIISLIMITTVSGAIWFVIHYWMIEPTKKWEKILVFSFSVICGSVEAIWHLQPSGTALLEYSPIFCVQAGIGLVAIVVAYWNSNLKNQVSNMVGFFIIVYSVVYIWYLYTGVNLFLYVIKSGANVGGFFLVLLLLLFLLAVIWDSGKPWNKKISHYILVPCAVALVVVALVGNFLIFTGATNSKEWSLNAAFNNLQLRKADKQIEGVMDNYQGMSFDDIQEIVNDENSSLEQIKEAEMILDYMLDNAQNIVANKRPIRVTFNVPRAKWLLGKFPSFSFNSGGVSKNKGKGFTVSEFRPVDVSKTPVKMAQIADGDVVEYVSPYGFWVVYPDGTSSYHNPSKERGEIRSFTITDAPRKKAPMLVYSNNNDFQLEVRVKSRS